MADKILTAKFLVGSDAELKTLPSEKYSKAVSDDVVKKTIKSLETLGHKVSIVDSAADAVKLLGGLIPDGSSIGVGGSITLEEIGFIDYLKNRTNVKNYRALALDLMAKNDWAGSAAVRREGMSADYFFSSVSAVAETGEIVGADATGTRVGGWVNAAKNLVLVVGTNKIVADYDAAVKRLREYQLPLESARCRIVYKAPKSNITNIVSIMSGNPYAKERIHVVFVKGAWGY